MFEGLLQPWHLFLILVVTLIVFGPGKLPEVGAGRCNVVARWSTGRRPVVLLTGHLDTVPVGAGWTRDPFGAEVSAGRLYGRVNWSYWTAPDGLLRHGKGRDGRFFACSWDRVARAVPRDPKRDRFDRTGVDGGPPPGVALVSAIAFPGRLESSPSLGPYRG